MLKRKKIGALGYVALRVYETNQMLRTVDTQLTSRVVESFIPFLCVHDDCTECKLRARMFL